MSLSFVSGSDLIAGPGLGSGLTAEAPMFDIIVRSQWSVEAKEMAMADMKIYLGPEKLLKGAGRDGCVCMLFRMKLRDNSMKSLDHVIMGIRFRFTAIMASAEVTSALAAIDATSNQQAKAVRYNELLSQIVSSSSPTTISQDLIAFLGSILSENVSIIASRPLLDAFINALRTLPADVQINVGQHAIHALQSRSTSVEEQDSSIRGILADAYESQDEYLAAARVLQGIHLDSSQRLISDEDKMRMWIRIVRLYLEEDDPTSAEGFLNKIKNLPSKIQDQELKLHFQLSQARILDARRRFLDASQEYLNRRYSGIISLPRKK
ncbi:COP9 signalosome complex subunit 4 [Coccidioides immitis RMSCC 3703]|uniref:COP9 signalosome complex subunit 4 n=1 Tax=Coccidioides immitis RMSCC 3703 TaxID=454286 RepID=A0A0J8QR67_COCIT|nr:COP9 signalosome complex subunit 4 [Coccidioides immitis RMSCC 3703]